ncbi:hypothetical protein HID58_049367 [Brassica napus]|uniref:DUF538 family protein n=3 Tax=Brassica TaxID=3705 RepID=A0A0D3AWV6_BRAOL|nr:PREDICTED: uncharacterized protein LOC106321012 [Brassica oleracea var. oleracea]XP_013677707.1 uncharacterized protein BNAC02G38620D [Brassica napus]KAH0899799.1 hypothetical protein HID58_049367 [Brassica napus]CAF1920646.1 unnamed protein product [Brassica napus]VDD26627.1 unnamed protein product [Brassica oleracea]
MMMHRVLHLLIISTLAISILAENDSIYDVLKAHALPMGLLPKGVEEFNVDMETGQFSVYLNRSCEAKYESEIHYEANITGTIGYGSIGGLSGIKAHDLFLWFPVKGIRVDIPSSGVIYFDVGVVRKQYSMSVFETPKDCVAVENEAEFRGDNKIQSSMLQFYEVDQSVGRNIV